MAPLRKIVKRKSLGSDKVTMSKLGRYLNMRWSPLMVLLVLECGHTIKRRDYGAPKDQARCQACEKAEKEKGQAA